jgi:hypothetical protein
MTTCSGHIFNGFGALVPKPFFCMAKLIHTHNVQSKGPPATTLVARLIVDSFQAAADKGELTSSSRLLNKP